MRTRPPLASTRFSTSACAPTSAAVPVRISTGICRWARAIGRTIASVASDPRMKTSTCSHAAPPRMATMPAGTAASATGPRKKSPGVASSPSASRTATIAQITQPAMTPLCARACCSASGIATAVERPLCRGLLHHNAECSGERAQIGQTVGVIGKAAVAIDEPRLHTHCTCPRDIVVGIIANHRRALGGYVKSFEQRAEDRLVGLRLSVHARCEDGIDLDAVVRHERIEVAARIREQGELQTVTSQLVEHGQRIVEQLEVLRTLPGACHLDCAPIGVADAPHPLDDPLGEEDPYLLVVFQLGMPLQRRDFDVPRVKRAVVRPCDGLGDRPAAGTLTVEPELRRDAVEAMQYCALAVPELEASRDRRDGELPLADQWLGIDHEPRLALRREHVVEVQIASVWNGGPA